MKFLQKLKKYDEALATSKYFHLEISPKNYPLTIAKSKLLLEMKKYFESEELIRDQLIRRNEDPELWLLLSEIQRNSKNIVGLSSIASRIFFIARSK